MEVAIHVTATVRTVRRVTARFALVLCVALSPFGAFAQDANVGKTLYNTPLVSGQLSCAAGACHGPDPLTRQNRIQNGDTPGAIGLAINSYVQMAFLRGQVSGAQLTNIAAYIADPAAATGSPAAQLSVSALTFAATSVGLTSAAQQITVTNNGTLPLVVGAVSANSPDFSANTACSTVAVGANCTITVTFAPTASGARSATLQIVHNGAGGQSTVALSGVGVAAPVASVSAQSIDFGSVTLPFFSLPRTVTVSNTGNSPLQLLAISVTGSSFSREGGDCAANSTLAPLSSCTVALRFTPLADGPASGSLTIAHNASAQPIVVSLVGFGTSTPAVTRTMTEYLYVPLQYYFITSRDEEKALLDQSASFQRTGLQFKVFVSQQQGSVGISRYYFDKAALSGSRGTHFYTLLDSEKLLLAALNPDNSAAPLKPFNEGIDSFAHVPLGSGTGASCAPGLQPVYRIFRGNLKFPDDPNHRFTSNQSVYQNMVAAGWDDEGIKFCVPE
jgi:Abnormal spindle-like microcephaly-assoc'd, ASPM-SPD-2-Hydin/Repeat of unknown function (DUF5648)